MRCAAILMMLALTAWGCEEEEKLGSIESRCEDARDDTVRECSGLDDCPRLDCLCNDGVIVSSRSCAGGMCVAQTAMCTTSCEDKGGWACAAADADAAVAPVSSQP